MLDEMTLESLFIQFVIFDQLLKLSFKSHFITWLSI